MDRTGDNAARLGRRGKATPNEQRRDVRLHGGVGAPAPNRRATAAAAVSVAGLGATGMRASISLRSGLPWQKPIAGSRWDAARQGNLTVSTETSVKPARARSARTVATSW